MATTEMNCLASGGGGASEFNAKIKIPTAMENCVILDTLGLTKLDISNSQSSSSATVRKANVTDWSTFAYTDLTNIGTLENVQSLSAQDLTGFNALVLGANNRTNHALVTLKMYN